MTAPRLAFLFGLLFLVAGGLALLPATAPLAPFDAPVVVTLDPHYRLLFGLFPVNLAHDAIHLLVGVFGLIAARSFASATGYFRKLFWFYLLVGILGAIPITNTLFGIAPIYGWDVLLHLGTAVVAWFAGYGRLSVEPLPTLP